MIRFLKALLISCIGVAGLMVTAGPASAHTPSHTVNCQTGVTLRATNYQSNQTNRWSMTVNGVTQSGTFGTNFSKTIPVPQGHTTSTWAVSIDVVQSNQYDYYRSGSVGPCGSLPPPPPPQPVTPAVPKHLDPCGPNNVSWTQVPPETPQYTVTGTLTSALTFTLKQGWIWTDGTTAPKTFPLPADSNVACPEPPTVTPPPPTRPEPKRAKVGVHKVDKCNCYRDKAWLTYDESKVKVEGKRVTKTKWVFKVTGKIASNGVQYLVQGQHGGWDETQTYVVKTTNKPCPCKERGDCPENYTPPTPPCRPGKPC